MALPAYRPDPGGTCGRQTAQAPRDPAGAVGNRQRVVRAAANPDHGLPRLPDLRRIPGPLRIPGTDPRDQGAGTPPEPPPAFRPPPPGHPPRPGGRHAPAKPPPP